MPTNYHPSILTGILIPIFLWITFTPWSGDLDLIISRFFYQNGTFTNHFFWNWVYLYGLWPSWLVSLTALLGLTFSLFRKYRAWRLPCLYFLLTFALGGGVLIHAVFKENWGRPRPRQIIEFGGTQPFRPYFKPNSESPPEPSKSFSSGHASAGFVFFSIAILGSIYQSSIIYYLGMGIAWTLGGLLSLARIAQGGHFLSDTLATALIMWLIAWCLAYVMFYKRKLKDERVNS